MKVVVTDRQCRRRGQVQFQLNLCPFPSGKVDVVPAWIVPFPLVPEYGKIVIPAFAGMTILLVL